MCTCAVHVCMCIQLLLLIYVMDCSTQVNFFFYYTQFFKQVYKIGESTEVGSVHNVKKNIGKCPFVPFPLFIMLIMSNDNDNDLRRRRRARKPVVIIIVQYQNCSLVMWIRFNFELNNFVNVVGWLDLSRSAFQSKITLNRKMYIFSS